MGSCDFMGISGRSNTLTPEPLLHLTLRLNSGLLRNPCAGPGFQKLGIDPDTGLLPLLHLSFSLSHCCNLTPQPLNSLLSRTSHSRPLLRARSNSELILRMLFRRLDNAQAPALGALRCLARSPGPRDFHNFTSGSDFSMHDSRGCRVFLNFQAFRRCAMGYLRSQNLSPSRSRCGNGGSSYNAILFLLILLQLCLHPHFHFHFHFHFLLLLLLLPLLDRLTEPDQGAPEYAKAVGEHAIETGFGGFNGFGLRLGGHVWPCGDSSGVIFGDGVIGGLGLHSGWLMRV
ncbi:hypothetical protein B9Z19DRAFT_1074058, partial [Tuber borchii]